MKPEQLIIPVNEKANVNITIDDNLAADYKRCMKDNDIKFKCADCSLNSKYTGCLVAFPELITKLEYIISSQ